MLVILRLVNESLDTEGIGKTLKTYGSTKVFKSICQSFKKCFIGGDAFKLCSTSLESLKIN